MIVFVIYLVTLYFVGQFLNITFQIEIELLMSHLFLPVTLYPPPATRHPPPVTRHPPPATRHPPPATRHPPPATRHPPPATRHPPPVTRHPPPVTRHPPPATRHPPPVTRHPPPATRHPPPATRHPPPVTRHPSSATRHPSPATRDPSSATRHPSSAARHPSPVIRHPPPVTRHPPPATRHPPPVTRHPPPVTRHPPPATRHPPPVTRHPHPPPVIRHPPPVIRHPSPVIRHPPPVTRHPSPATRHPWKSAAVFRVMQAELTSLQLFILLSFARGAVDLLERLTIVVRDYLWYFIYRKLNRDTPMLSAEKFRTPRSMRLTADMSIQMILGESTALIATVGFIQLYSFMYNEADPSFSELTPFFIRGIALSIDFVFNSFSFCLQMSYMNIAVVRVWESRWRKHMLVGLILSAVTMCYFTTHLFAVVKLKDKHSSGSKLNDFNCTGPFSRF